VPENARGDDTVSSLIVLIRACPPNRQPRRHGVHTRSIGDVSLPLCRRHAHRRRYRGAGSMDLGGSHACNLRARRERASRRLPAFESR
jgi:hypothetical protein